MSQDETIKVIAIKLPFDLQERILTFPFLHAISEYYPKAELHFITPKKEVEVLNLLPFKAYYHLFDEDEIKTVLDVHPFTANAKIYNVDLFISLTNSFADACLGLGLRAKRRVGFADNWKTIVLTDKINRLTGHHVVEDFATLFEIVIGRPIEKRVRVTSRNLTRIIVETDPYIAINLSPLREAVIEDEWGELISHFDNQKIILFSSEDQNRFQLQMQGFIERLPKNNTYVNFKYRDWIELGRMLAYTQGLISYSGACGAVAAYVGARSLLLYDNEDAQKTGPLYFLSDVAVMSSTNPTLTNPAMASAGALRPRQTFNMTEVFKKAHEFFNL